MSLDPFASVGGKPLPRIDDEGDSLGDPFDFTDVERAMLRHLDAGGEFAGTLHDIKTLPTTVGCPKEETL